MNTYAYFYITILSRIVIDMLYCEGTYVRIAVSLIRLSANNVSYLI